MSEANKCISKCMLPTCTILAAIWLSVNHFSREVERKGRNAFKTNRMEANSRYLELCVRSAFVNILWAQMYFLMDCVLRYCSFHVQGVYTCVCAFFFFFWLHLISESIYSTRSRIFIIQLSLL